VGNYWHRPLGAKLIILLAATFLVLTVFPWQRPCQVTADDKICGVVYSWNGFGVWAGVLAAAILVWELLPVVSPALSMRGWPTAVITAILGVAFALTTLVKMIEDNEFQTGWAWGGLAVALATMLVALLRVRYRWRIRGKDVERARSVASEPPAESTPPADTP
jgi:hypothetical protein